MKVYTNGLGHMTNVAATHLYGNNLLKIFFSRSSRLIAMKLDMMHWGCRPVIILTNYDPRLSMRYFTPRSSSVA